MTKTPGEFEPPKPITKAERDARKAFRQVDAEKAMTDHEIAQKAFSANRERLKAERLAREAAGTPVAAKKSQAQEEGQIAPRCRPRNCPGESVRSRHCVAANQDWLFTRAWEFLEWETLHECNGAAIQPCR